jgi:hypothetical protein
VKDDYSPVICISSSQLEAFKNKAAQTKTSNQVEQSENNIGEEIEYGEPVKTTFIETIFFSLIWKLTMVITSILLILTYVIEPFLGLNSTVETCESKEEVSIKHKRNYKTDVEYFFNIKLAREKKESDNRLLLVPQVVGERIKKGDKITIFHTKWRKENVEIKLKDGLIYPVRERYGMFIAMPIGHVLLCSVFFIAYNKQPSKKNKNQKLLRFYLFILNFMFSMLLLLSFWISAQNLF